MLFFESSTAAAQSVLSYWNNEMALVMMAAIIGSTPWVPRLTGRFSEFVHSKKPGSATAEFLGESVSICFVSAVFVCCAILLSAQTHNPFIYFRF